MTRRRKSDFIDIKSIIAEYRSKWYWFAISAILVCGLTYLYVRTLNPKYQLHAQVLVEREGSNPAIAALGSLGDIAGLKSDVDDEIHVITSHSVYRDVAKKLGINKKHNIKTAFLKTKLAYPDFPVDASMPEEIMDTLSSALRIGVDIDKAGKASVTVRDAKNKLVSEDNLTLPKTFETPYGPLTVFTTKYFKPGKAVDTSITFKGYDEAAEDLGAEVAGYIAAKKANVIGLDITTENKNYGRDILDGIIEQYNRLCIEDKNLQGTKTAQFIDDRLGILMQDLDENESLIQAYKQNRGIVDVEVEAKYQTTRRGKVDEGLTEAETEAEILKITYDFMNSPENKSALIPTTVENKALQEAINGYNELLLKRMELSASAKGENPVLKRLDQQIDAMHKNVLGSVKRAYDNSAVAVSEMRRKMNATQGKLGQIPVQEREFRNLERQQRVKQEIYVYLLERREETAMMLANALPKAKIVDNAFAYSKPVGMGKMTIMVMMLILAMCIPPCILYVRKLTRTKFSTREEVENLTDAPILGEISHSKSGHSLVVGQGFRSSAAELFALLRTKIGFMLNSKDKKVIAITSSRPGEGKSFVASNLAASLSLLNKKVLLVGLDLRKPRLAEYLDLNPRMGLSQYLSSSDVTLQSMECKLNGLPDMTIITAGPVPPNPGELLASRKLDEFIEQMRGEYDYIILDSAPAGKVSDPFVTNRFVDLTVYVVKADFTTRSEIDFLNELHEEGKINNLAVVINGTRNRESYTYGYGEDK